MNRNFVITPLSEILSRSQKIKKFDDPKLANEFMAEAKAISDSRNIGRAHYPSDSKFGIELGKKMFRYIKKDIENKL